MEHVRFGDEEKEGMRRAKLGNSGSFRAMAYLARWVTGKLQ